MRFKFGAGDDVLKIPCPPDCACDGKAIPPGSPGRIIAGNKPRLMQNYAGVEEPYYNVVWTVKGVERLWGTFEHGIESVAFFPDISYLEGV